MVPRDCYQRLGMNDELRHEGYKHLFTVDLGKEAVEKITRALTFSMPLGDTRFQQQIEAALGRKVGQAYKGRPKKKIN